MPTITLPKPIRVEPQHRERLTVYAIGAAFRSGRPLTEESQFSIEEPSHIVRAVTASDAMRGFLASADAKEVERWDDSDTSQRLHYVVAISRLRRIALYSSHIEVSTTHRRVDGRPIRYLRGWLTAELYRTEMRTLLEKIQAREKAVWSDGAGSRQKLAELAGSISYVAERGLSILDALDKLAK